ncbi:MAG TPA: MBL fold metallo-hydrolase [Acidimicrobiales bacterium]|jgi:glyoxylase-like metal-dependent hydrolase (beta-lactamase superfamily II)|nr:MBL fold metallo-hydrolase [Acidimicrobiales bacterium]
MAIYFRQWLSGTSFAERDPVAGQMVNFAYAIGDASTREAVLVDPAYDVGALLALLAADEMTCVGVVATHYHADHVGGSLFGVTIEGIATLLRGLDVPIHVQADEAPWIERTTGVDDALVRHRSGDVVTVGDVGIELLHTPGHTPGSQCLLVDGRLVTGDTLFLDGCGRTDLPGSDPAEMYETLTRRLSRIDAATMVFPGHRYSPEPSLPMGEVRARNVALAPRSADEWLAAFS